MNDIQTRELVATGDAFVTTLEDIRMVRDRAVAAEREAIANQLEVRAARCRTGLRIDMEIAAALEAEAAAIRARGNP